MSRHNTRAVLWRLCLLFGIVVGLSVGSLGAQAGDIIESEGAVEPVRSADLAFVNGGTVSAIFVAEGDTVSAGAVLAELANTDATLALQQASARRASAEAALAVAEAAQARAQAAVDTAAEQVRAAAANLALVEAGARPSAIRAAAAAVAAAEGAIAQAEGARNDLLTVRDEAVAAAQAELAAADAALESAENDYQEVFDTCFEAQDGSEICPLAGPVEEARRAQVQIAEANRAAAVAALADAQRGATTAERAAASADVAAAIAQRDVAAAQLARLQEPVRPEAIAPAAIAVRQAEAGMTVAMARIAEADAGVAQAEAALALALTDERSAAAQLARLALTAPFDGVVAAVDLDVGQVVGPAQPVMTLGDQSAWRVVATDVSELDIAALAVGDEASIAFEALPNMTTTGTIATVDLLAGLSRGDVVYRVTLDLPDGATLPLRWGLSAEVTFSP